MIAVAIAATAQGAAVLALRAPDRDLGAAAPEVDRDLATPVKIVPVLDLDSPLLKLGGKRDPQRLPDKWVRQTPKARVEEKAFVSTKAGKSEADIPPPEVAVADAGTPPPPETAEITKQVDTPIAPEVDAGPSPPANVAEEGHQDGVKEGTETDPLKARAVDLYRARIIGWFSRRFRVSGSGLSAEELAKYKVSAAVDLSADRQVLGYSIVPSGNTAFDAAARAALDGAKGQELPQPPENYPDVVQRTIKLTFVCKENRCD